MQPRDAREASDVFYKQKTGDALLTYENEVIVTNESMAPAKRLPYVVPQYNISVSLHPLGARAGCLRSKHPCVRHGKAHLAAYRVHYP